MQGQKNDSSTATTDHHSVAPLRAKVRGANLEQSAGLFDQFSLGYLNPLLRLGAITPLLHTDLGTIHAHDRASHAHVRFQAAWRKYAALRNPGEPVPMVSLMLDVLGRADLCLAIGLYFIKAVADFGPVLLLNRIVSHFQGTDPMGSSFAVWACVAGLLILPVLSSVSYARHAVIVAHLSVRLRTAISVALHRKALVLSPDARAKTSTGEIINMMSNDTSQMQRFVQIGMTLVVVAPFQVIACVVLIWLQVGPATLVGVALMLCTGPIMGKLFVNVMRLRREVLRHSDSRVKLMNEILCGIRIIKYSSWEEPFIQKIQAIRNLEMAALRKLCFFIAFGFSFVLLGLPIVLPVIVFATYSADGTNIDAATAFTTLALFSLLRFPFAFMPMGLVQYAQAKIALARIAKYLELDEFSQYVDELPETSPVTVLLEKAAFSWEMPESLQASTSNSSKKAKGVQLSSEGAAPIARTAVEAELERNEQSCVALSEPNFDTVEPSNDQTSSVNVELMPILQKISFEVKKGELIALVGPVGAGKSSMLSAILGDMIHRSGTVARRGSIALCSQEPWIFNATMQQNVLYTKTPEELNDVDHERYERALDLACLRDDIAQLPNGQHTSIGDRGINLSGGQKARTAFARAIFSDADILLLDDPLSAVDAHVGEKLFEAIREGLDGKTRILVTHQTQFLDQCDRIIVLRNREIYASGTHDQLVAQGIDFSGLASEEDEALQQRKAIKMAKDARAAEKAKALAAQTGHGKRRGRGGRGRGRGGGRAQGGGRGRGGGRGAGRGGSNSPEHEEEERVTGSVAWDVYAHYIRMGGCGFAACVFACSLTGRAGEIGANFWLSHWSERTLAMSDSGDAGAPHSTAYYMGIYSALSMAGVMFITGRSVALAFLRVQAAQKLHDRLTASVLRAPVRFFDTTPIGRVLNRFAADCDRVDLELGASLAQVLNCAMNVLGALVAIIGATQGAFALLLVPIIFAYYRVQGYFRCSNTEVQRLESISRTPIFASFSQTLSGISTIRAFDQTEATNEQNERALDANNVALVLQQLLNGWLTLRLDIIGGFIMACIAAFTELTNDFVSAGSLAIGLLFANEMSRFLQHGVKMWATAEAQMNSVERMRYYADELDSEAPRTLSSDPCASKWPSRGEIAVKGAVMAYGNGPDVLKDLTFRLLPKEKVGIVGRTGSGKTSFMSALFRICELKAGAIEIDGVDISTLGLGRLRSAMSIIPQDPVIFNGTIRFNLDPFDLYDDAQIYEVLERVQLKDMLVSKSESQDQNKTAVDAKDTRSPQGQNSVPPATALTVKCSEGGQNLSVGERQLLCIARALLRRSSIVLLDEATASVDNETDHVIQSLIREQFKDSTVLTVAHRLRTVMDTDRILVLDDGRVAELDSPSILLANSSGMLRAMVDATGEASAFELEEIAKAAAAAGGGEGGVAAATTTAATSHNKQSINTT